MNSLLYLIIRSIFIDYLFIFIFMYLIGLKHIVYFISECRIHLIEIIK